MHNSDQKSKKAILKLILAFNLLLIILVACGGASTSDEDDGYATWTPSPSSTPTCVPNIQLSTPEGWGTSSRLIVVLYDPRTTENRDLELTNGEKTQDIPYFITRIIPMLMRPSDQVSIFQLGYSSYDSARVTRLYSYTTAPQLYNTPSPRETLTPLPPTTIPSPGFQAVATQNFVRTQLTARASTEAAAEAKYSCEVNYWNDNVKLTATAWDGTATAEIGGISDQLDTEIENFKNSGNATEKPFSTNELYYGGVYYGLNFASTVFQSDCKKYNECILIIIDDLETWGENNPENLPIDLGKVKIYSILPNCKDLDQPSCVKLREYWTVEFEKFGAVDMVYWNETRVELNLLSAIGR